MFYRLNRRLDVARFDRAIQGILGTVPLTLIDAPLCVVSMVANDHVPMYLLAMKSFYPKLGRGKVVAIINRDMPQASRDMLSRHLVGIEFVILEDIPTAPCQRGGTWERLLYCLDRSEREYTIQLDCDTLTVGGDISEVLDCVAANQAFTMADGFVRLTLPEAAELAQNTPSNYIGISAEAVFDRYPGGEHLHHIRGSSGFVGFARGGYTRASMAEFHGNMETLLGSERWREWGSEQCGSNFAIANSPDPLVLPFPEYASFKPRAPRKPTKLFHFIGRYRYLDGYYVARGREVIAALTPGATAPVLSPRHPANRDNQSPDPYPLAFTRSMTLASAAAYLRWRLGGRKEPVVVQMRPRDDFQDNPGPGPILQMRPRSAGNSDAGVAYEIFVHQFMLPPVWIPPERVKLVVDLGANVGMSCLWWLANYWRARVIAYEAHPRHAAQLTANIARNNWQDRIELHAEAAGTVAGSASLSDEGAASELSASGGGGMQVPVVDVLGALAGQPIDILKIDIEGSEVELLDDPRFAELDVKVIVMEWHMRRPDGRGGRAWCLDRLHALGARTYIVHEEGPYGMVWAYLPR